MRKDRFQDCMFLVEVLALFHEGNTDIITVYHTPGIVGF